MVLVFKNPTRFLTAKNLQRFFTATVLLLVLGVAGVLSLNHFTLQKHLNRVIAQDARLQGVRAKVYYDSHVKWHTIIFDVHEVGQPAGPLGLLLTFFQFAHELQGRELDEVYLAYRGHRKLKLDGDDFLELGAALGTVRPAELARLLVGDLRLLNGKMLVNQLSKRRYDLIVGRNMPNNREDEAAKELLGTIIE